jgi:hypothetical protein
MLQRRAHTQMFVASTTTVGDLTTTCLNIVPMGCYQMRTDCCAKLASSWQRLDIGIGAL